MPASAKLSDPNNTAIAVFAKPDGQFSIVLGNLPEGVVPDISAWLRREGKTFFGGIVQGDYTDCKRAQ